MHLFFKTHAILSKGLIAELALDSSCKLENHKKINKSVFLMTLQNVQSASPQKTQHIGYYKKFEE